MSVTQPEFIRLLPGEVKRYGANAALVLAHIRFRCESDWPGCVIVDGVRHWRVTHSDLGAEVGLTPEACRRAVEKLTGDAISAKLLAPLNNKAMAYALTSHLAKLPDRDQPFGEIAVPNGEIAVPNGEIAVPNGEIAVPNGEIAVATTYREGREGGEGAGSVGDGTGSGVVAVPANQQKQPQRYCSRHMPDGTDDDCGACGRRREAFDRWTAAASAAESARRRDAAAAEGFKCTICFDTGTKRNSTGVVSRGRPRCHCAAGENGTMASGKGMA